VPFRTRPGQPRDLLALVDGEVRERIEDAVDHAVLEAMVQARRRRGRPAPVADSPADRREFEAGVRRFLERLRADLEPAVEGQQRARVSEAVAGAGRDPLARLVAGQVALAKTLPDYWQRFEAVRLAYAAEPPGSGRERRGLLGRFLPR
jgi:hypothetical protein